MLYEEGSRILGSIVAKQGSIKNLVFNSFYENKKQLYALVCETLKYRGVIDEILRETKLQQVETNLGNAHLAELLVYDFLFGKGIDPTCHLKNCIQRHARALEYQLANIKKSRGATDNSDLIDAQDKINLPRYVRVNTLKTAVDTVVEAFINEDYLLVEADADMDYNEYVELLGSLREEQFVRDIHLTDMLVFAAGTDFHEHALYISGDIILQDKSSCIPAHVLHAKPGSDIIDSCAAPGNKTSHICALTHNNSAVFAFDMDGRRVTTMRSLLLKAGASAVQCEQQDFLKVDATSDRYANVRYILVDPSCSGSGMVQRDGRLVDGSDVTSSRLDQLAGFQAKLLKHALSFPRVKRVVYSTCSVFAEENERVVCEVLQQVGDRFNLKNILPQLPRRGQDTYTLHGRKKTVVFDEAGKCIRLQPSADLTNGFFVACFQRRKTPLRKTADDACDDNDIDSKQVAGRRKPHLYDLEDSTATVYNEEAGEDASAASLNSNNISHNRNQQWKADRRDSVHYEATTKNIQKKKRKREHRQEGHVSSRVSQQAPLPTISTKTGKSKKKQKRW